MSGVRVLLKNTAALSVAEIVSKVVSTLYFVILARYVGVDGVGQISAGQAVVYTLILLVGFGMDQLLIRDVSADKSRVGPYVTTVLALRVVLAALFVGILVIVVNALGYSRELATIAYLYGANAVLRAFTDVALDVFRAYERMEYNLVVRVSRDVINVVLSLIAIWMGAEIAWIVMVSVAASALELVLAWMLFRRHFDVPLPRPDLLVGKRMLVTALPFLLVAVYPLAQSQLNTIVLSATASVTQVGRFAAANTVMAMLLLAPSIFTQALYPVFSRLSTRESSARGSRLRMAYRKSFDYMFMLGAAVSVGTYLTADRILPLVLGEAFIQAVPAMKILAWLPVVSYVGFCSGNYLTAAGRERLYVVTEGVFTVLNVIVVILVTPRFGYLGACWVMLGAAAVGFAFYTLLCHRLLGLALPWTTMAASLGAVLVMAVIVSWSLEHGVNPFAVIVLVGPVAYGAMLGLLRGVTGEDLALLKEALRPA